MIALSRPWRIKKDFDSWGYHIQWPQNKLLSPLTGKVDFAVEDIKFAYNAWSLLRLAMFFGVHYPKVLSNMTNTTPSMDLVLDGNRLFFMHARVNESLDNNKVRVALTPHNPLAFPIQDFNWETHCRAYRPSATGVELVLGMENGLSPAIAGACDHCVYIPQYGSIGSLSMLSALAIAAHKTSCALLKNCQGMPDNHNAPLKALRGHMPLSNGTHQRRGGLPHESDLLSLSNADIKLTLEMRRRTYPLQLSIVIYNELGDRNIGAVIRNANVFNCDSVAIVNRKRFNRRGAIGTQKVLDVKFLESLKGSEAQQLLEANEVWLLYPYYPNLMIYGNTSPQSKQYDCSTFIRHDDPKLQAWCSSSHLLLETHPLIAAYPHLAHDPIFLDDDRSLIASVALVRRRGLRGILLAVPEEGCSPHTSLCEVSHRTVFIANPKHLPLGTQRGLNPALSTAIALERIRSAIDNL